MFGALISCRVPPLVFRPEWGYALVMNILAGSLPKEELRSRFGSRLILEEYGKKDIKSISRVKPEGLYSLGGNVWNRIIQKKWHSVDPGMLSPYFEAASPKLPVAIGRVVGAETIRDIYYVKGWQSPKSDSSLVVELLVAWVYKNDLHLGDITFMDPDAPLTGGSKRYAFQTHKGLGLLPVLMANLRKVAQELGCDQLTLTAAAADQSALFASHGFVVEDSETGRMGVANGAGIPMECAL